MKFPITQLEVETRSTCNRVCRGCLRNSHPDKEVVSAWHETHEMSVDTFYEIFRRARELGFSGNVCLSHYNEPMQDTRLADLASLVKGMGFQYVFACTNADYINAEIASRLDEFFDMLYVALYVWRSQPLNLEEHENWLRSKFKKTKLNFVSTDHMATHFSPLFPVEELAAANIDKPCMEPAKRTIINHKCEMLMCCDDLVGNFGLGNIHDSSLEELWYGEKHQEAIFALAQPGGRRKFDYCKTCPRG